MTKCGHCGAKAVLRERFIGDESDETCLMCGRSVVSSADLKARDEYLARRAVSNREAVVAGTRALNGAYWKEAS